MSLKNGDSVTFRRGDKVQKAQVAAISTDNAIVIFLENRKNKFKTVPLCDCLLDTTSPVSSKDDVKINMPLQMESTSYLKSFCFMLALMIFAIVFMSAMAYWYMLMIKVIIRIMSILKSLEKFGKKKKKLSFFIYFIFKCHLY